MHIFSKSEVQALNRNLRTFLILMADTIRVMREEKTDRVIDRMVTRNLNEESLGRLTVVSEKIEELQRDIHKEKEGKIFDADIEKLCSCPVHIKHLKQAGVVSLRDFFWPEDPLALHKALHEAEKESGAIPQPHLFASMTLKTTRLIKKAQERKNQK